MEMLIHNSIVIQAHIRYICTGKILSNTHYFKIDLNFSAKTKDIICRLNKKCVNEKTHF